VNGRSKNTEKEELRDACEHKDRQNGKKSKNPWQKDQLDLEETFEQEQRKFGNKNAKGKIDQHWIEPKTCAQKVGGADFSIKLIERKQRRRG
jgi:hypothetical protein